MDQVDSDQKLLDLLKNIDIVINMLGKLEQSRMNQAEQSVSVLTETSCTKPDTSCSNKPETSCVEPVNPSNSNAKQLAEIEDENNEWLNKNL